ncbi:MAG: 2-hydroxyacyl-CoA dehydratase family protein [Deferrisomatales bacterium]
MSDAAARSKKKAIAPLQSAYALRAAVDASYKESVAAMAAGKPTAWAMANWWQGSPILKAMDVETVYPENYGAVCAATGVAQRYLQIADAAGFPTHLCGYMRTNLGYTHRMVRELGGAIPPEAPLGGMPKPVLLLGSGIVCDPRYKWFQALGRYLDAPVYVLEMPNPGTKELFRKGVYESCVRFVVEDIREFIAFLERLLGKRMDYDRLEEVVDDMLTMLRVWHEVNDLRKARPCPMHARHFWTCMPQALFLLGDLKEAIANYRALYEEVSRLVSEGQGAVVEERYRLGWCELPPWHSLGFFDLLAERGWNFVVESLGYHPPLPFDAGGIRDPVEKIARNTLQWYTGYYRYFQDGTTQMGFLGDPYLKWAREYHLDGMFLHQLLTCRTASNHLGYVREILASRAHIPSLELQGDIVDFSLFDPDDALRKAEAFEEAMEYHREKRAAQEGRSAGRA